MGKKIIVAQRIKELMKEHNLTQINLAQKVGVKQNTVSTWILGINEPSINSLWSLADYFGVSIDYIVGREEY